jgi:type III restriction enzyme
MSKDNGHPLPVQPVAKPILCSPYEEPTEHWVYDSATGQAERVPGRRRAFYWYKTERVMSQQLRLGFVAEEESEELPLVIAPEHEPTAVFVKPRVGYEVGPPTMTGPGKFEKQDRQTYYQSTHLQTIAFEIARQIVTVLGGEEFQQPGLQGDPQLRGQSRHQLFPQVLRLVYAYIRRRVNFRGVDPRELGQQRYTQLIVERLLAAIKPDDGAGEAPLLPILNRYQPTGSTADVDFKTTRPCFVTTYSHINLVAADTARWEQSAAFRLEAAAQKGLVRFYARNDELGLMIPYDFLGTGHHYQPDFLVHLADGTTLVLEIKGQESEQDRAKHAAARRWIEAVNNWGQLGRWAFHVCKDPQVLEQALGQIARGNSRGT